MTRMKPPGPTVPSRTDPLLTKEKRDPPATPRTHGLCSEIVVMEGESQEAFDALAAAIFASHVPVTIEEADLVFEIAANRWRLRRCMEMEKALFEEQMRPPPHRQRKPDHRCAGSPPQSTGARRRKLSDEAAASS